MVGGTYSHFTKRKCDLWKAKEMAITMLVHENANPTAKKWPVGSANFKYLVETQGFPINLFVSKIFLAMEKLIDKQDTAENKVQASSLLQW